MKKKKQEKPVVLIAIIIFVAGLFVGVFASPFLLPEPTVQTDDHTHSHDLDHSHDHMHSMFEVDPTLPVPSVDLIIYETPSKKGYNLEIVPTNFEFAPRAVDTEYIANQGHAHLYVDGDKITRLYDNWYFLDGLDAGEYTVKVSLNGNNHTGLTFNGEEIADEELLIVE